MTFTADDLADGVDFNTPCGSQPSIASSSSPERANRWMRYISMFSSPNTRFNNAFSNLANITIVAPLEKSLTSTLDFLRSMFRGKQQILFASDGQAFRHGYWSNLGSAAHNFADTLCGQTETNNLDTRSILLATEGA